MLKFIGLVALGYRADNWFGKGLEYHTAPYERNQNVIKCKIPHYVNTGIFRSQQSEWFQAGQPGFESQQEQGLFSSLSCPEWFWGSPKLLSYPFSGLKQLECEADHWSCSVPIYCTVLKHRDNFTISEQINTFTAVSGVCFCCLTWKLWMSSISYCLKRTFFVSCNRWRTCATSCRWFMRQSLHCLSRWMNLWRL